MRIRSFILLLFAILFVLDNSKSQDLNKKAFKEAKTIRLYVNDTSKHEAIVRFARYINETGFQALIPESNLKSETNEENDELSKPTFIQSKKALGSAQTGDTISTNTATLYDIMMGDFDGMLKFYPAKDNSSNIYIAVTGYVSNSAFGGNFKNLQMQKGGKGANWAQKALFKQLNNHILKYTGVNKILYSDE